MARTARRISESDVYHLTGRGVGLQSIFEDNYDHEAFLDFLKILPENDVEVLAWCLMGNHFHLLVGAPLSALSSTMRKLLSSYALYFNMRHGRTGHLFQDRFGSEPIESDAHLLEAVRYIHQNPVKAKISSTCNYRWSSYLEYVTATKGGLCSTHLVKEMLGHTEEIIRFHEVEESAHLFRDALPVRKRMGDRDARELLEKRFGEGFALQLSLLDKTTRNDALSEMKSAGLSVRQLQRLTGIGFGIITRA